MPKKLFNSTKGIRERRSRASTVTLFPLGFNEDRRASCYSWTSNLRRGIVVIKARLEIRARPGIGVRPGIRVRSEATDLQ